MTVISPPYNGLNAQSLEIRGESNMVARTDAMGATSASSDAANIATLRPRQLFTGATPTSFS